VIQVRRGVAFVKGRIRVEPPKADADIRDFAIPPNLIPIFKEHPEAHAAAGKEALLFPSDTRRRQWPSTVTGYFKKATEAAGRSDLRCHDLRHTGAAMAAQQGATLAHLQACLEHKRSANMSDMYEHLTGDKCSRSLHSGRRAQR